MNMSEFIIGFCSGFLLVVAIYNIIKRLRHEMRDLF